MTHRLLLLCWLLAPSLVWGAVTFVQAVSENTGANLSDILSYTMTVSAGTNRVLLVSLCTANPPVVLSATFDEEPLTLIAEIASTNSIGHAALYQLVNPPVATGTVEFVIDAAFPRRMTSGAIALTGGHQATPHDTAVTAQNADTTLTLSVSVATTTDDLLVDVLCNRNSLGTLTMDAASGRTQRYTNVTTNTTLGNNARIAGSTRTGTGTLALGWTVSNQVGLAEVGVNMNTAPAAPAGGALSLGIRMLQ